MFFAIKRTTSIQTSGLNIQNRLLLAREAGIWLGYQVLHVSEKGIQFQVNDSIFESRHTLEITPEGTGLKVHERFLTVFHRSNQERTGKIFSKIFRRFEENLPEHWFENAKKQQVADGLWSEPEEFIPLESRPLEPLTITPILLLVNIGVFLSMYFETGSWKIPEMKNFVEWGANFRPLVLDGEYYRLITYSFLHLDLNHIIFNLLILAFGGSVLELFLGRNRFLIYYLIFTLIAGLGSLYWNEGKIAFGASGPIYGIIGMLLVTGFTDFMERQIKISVLICLSIFLGKSYLEFDTHSIVDNAAHISGFFAGIVMGIISLPSLEAPLNLKIKWNTSIYSLLVALALCFFLIRMLPNDFIELEALAKKMHENQTFAETHNQNWNQLSKREALMKLREDIIMKYDENIRLCNEVRKLKVTPANLERNEILLEYYVLKSNYFRLLSRQIRDPDPKNLSNLQNGNKNILDMENAYGYIFKLKNWAIPVY